MALPELPPPNPMNHPHQLPLPHPSMPHAHSNGALTPPQQQQQHFQQQQQQQQQHQQQQQQAMVESGEEAAPNGGKVKRSKRAKYVGSACHECKRRKIKCNGESPCQRCKNFSLDCIYSVGSCCQNSFRQSTEFKEITEKLASLQKSIAHLIESSATQNGTSAHSSCDARNGDNSQIPEQYAPETQQQDQSRRKVSYSGPTSIAFSFGVAHNSLNTLGITPEEEDDEEEEVTSPAETPAMSQGSPGFQGSMARGGNSVSSVASSVSTRIREEPLFAISRPDVARLFDLYHDEIQVMYPIFDYEEFVRRALPLWEGKGRLEDLTKLQQAQLRLVLAVALAVERGEEELGRRLYDNVRKGYDVDSEPTLGMLIALVLMSIYQFHIDNESMAYRTIGLAVRVSLELGLHRTEELSRKYPDPRDRSWVVKLFWSIYVLDHRWSFGTGRPFSLRDSDIDPDMPQAENISENCYSALYLQNMVHYSRVAARVWDAIAAGKEGVPPNSQNVDLRYLDLLVIDWQQSLPAELHYQDISTPPPQPSAYPKFLKKLQVILFVRANQMRLHIYRPLLLSAANISSNMAGARLAVDTARDTIRVLANLNGTSDLFARCQIHYNHFLLSALAVIFAAVAHAPKVFSDICREEFYMGLSLVKLLSKKSNSSRRLWRTLKSLRRLGPRLGLRAPQNSLQNNNVSSDASSRIYMRASDMSPMASDMEFSSGSMISPHAYSPSVEIAGEMGDSPLDGYQISAEMNQWFTDATAKAAMEGEGLFLQGEPGDMAFGVVGASAGFLPDSAVGVEFMQAFQDLF
ncbi:hypothetical protein RUND412_006031 [Rhizina undulata]